MSNLDFVFVPAALADIDGLQPALDLKMNAAEAYTKAAGDARYGQLAAANAWTARQSLNLSADGAWLECLDPTSDSITRFAVVRTGGSVAVNVGARGSGTTASLVVGGLSGAINGVMLGLIDSSYGIGPAGSATVVKLGGRLVPNGSGTLDLGASSRRFNNVYLNNLIVPTNVTAVPVPLTVNASTSATPGAGFGPQILLAGNSSTTASRTMATISALWSDATDASRTSEIPFSNIRNGVLSEAMRINSSGCLLIGMTSGGGVIYSADMAGSLMVRGNVLQFGTPAAPKDICTVQSNTILSLGGSNLSTLRFKLGANEIARFELNGNLGINTTDQFGGGVKVIGVANCTTVPTTNPTGGGILYSEGGALKWRGSSGTVTTVAPP